MLGIVPPVWLTWLTVTWAAGWALWATIDSFLVPRHELPLRICHTLHALFCLQWWGLMTVQFLGVWDRAQYLKVVAPYAPVVFFAGPWSIWPIKHWFYRRTVRGTMTTVGEIEGSA